MKLPADAIISREKLTRYLLVHQARGDKSAFLARAGYNLENADQLLDDLRTQILPLDATPLHSTAFGNFYEIRGALIGPKRCRTKCSFYLDGRKVVGSHEVHYLSSGEIRTVRFELYSDAALSRDIAEHRLRRGDLVKIVDHHKSVDGEIGYSIEVFNATGETIAVAAVPESALEPLHKDEVLSVRPLAVT
jgi:Domain of unknown function (DUF4926)